MAHPLPLNISTRQESYESQLPEQKWNKMLGTCSLAQVNTASESATMVGLIHRWLIPT